MSGVKAAVVVPTRNRADLAMNAIRSVLDEALENVDVFVSDNSTWVGEVESLAQECAHLADSHVTYLRPPVPLAMTPHWDWALQQAMSISDATHLLYLTDRMMFKIGGLREVLELAALYPDRVISYNHDRIIDDSRPIRIEEYASTGKLLELQTDRILWLYSECTVFNALPRMLNTLVPRAALQRIKDRFGSVFASIAPDFCFCCRCLDMERSILFYDKSVMFHYALDRSNGASVSRGEDSADSADFAANLTVPPAARNYATPIPELATSFNAVFNEYLIHRAETGSPRFRDMNMQKYLEFNAQEVHSMTEPSRSRMLAMLVAHGYVDPYPEAHAGAVTPPSDGKAQFERLEDAIQWARTRTLGGAQATRTYHELLDGREVPLPFAESGIPA